MPHPLDRPVWSTLTTRQSGLAQGDARALRIDPRYGPFAAAADSSPESLAALAALIPPDGVVWIVEAEETPTPPGVTALRQASLHQMSAAALTPAPSPAFEITPLTEADALEMRALATLTEPGPFLERTHRLGDFIGVKLEGRLIAMAGERMRPEGFTEVSGVCTHPGHRGQGYAGGLMRTVAGRILVRGETPFLHAYASNTGAISLYQSLGFTLRRPVTMTVLGR
ncbi:MAG: GNAT family N-acetyltransferase [Phenylobacterium sp.]